MKVAIVFSPDDEAEPTRPDLPLQRGSLIDGDTTSLLIAWIDDNGAAQFIGTGDFGHVKGEQIDHLAAGTPWSNERRRHGASSP